MDSGFVVGLVALCIVASLVGAVDPDFVPMRYRGGSVYANLKRRAADSGMASRNTTENWFTQWIDHNDHSKGTFQQRYFVDYSAWDGKGPGLLYIAGEGPVHGSPWGQPAVVGKNFSAVMVTVEHRFYGKSTFAPLTDKKAWQYLTVAQALADFASFPPYFNKQHGTTIKWFVVGGSYAGAVSAWSRLTYPDVFVASWSSSGVVHPILDFYEYDAHIESVIEPKCTNAIQTVLGIASDMWDHADSRAALRKLMGIPEYFTKVDVQWMLADSAAGSVQYGHKDEMCNSLLPVAADPLKQFYAMILKFWGPGQTSNCGYSTYCLSNASFVDQWLNADYPWLYQICSELGWWQIGYPSAIRSPTVSTAYFIDQCRQMFSADIFPDTFAFNKRMGGARPNATHVIALQGSDDPWQTAGVRETLSPEYVEVFAQCDGCGHCGDLFADTNTTKQVIKNQHAEIFKYLRKWVLG